MSWDGSGDEDEDEYEYEDEELEPAYLPCPECGEEIYEDLQQCPYCGQYITFSTSPWVGKPVAWVLLGILGALAVIVMLLMV